MRSYLALLIIALSPFGLLAQPDMSIDEAVRSFSKGSFPSFKMQINQMHLGDMQKDWISYLKTGSKNKPETANGEISMRGAVNANISPAPFNIYSVLIETPSGVVLTAWFTENDSVFISKDANDRDLAVQKYLYDFAVTQYREAYKKELKAENEKLKKLQNDLKDLIKQQDKATKKSNEASRSIDRNKDLIISNQTDQQNKQDQVTYQKQTVDNLKSNPGATLDAAKKELKGFESDLKKLINAKEKYYKEIDNWNKEIRDCQRNIENSTRDQGAKQIDIDKQQPVVQAVQAKLDNLK